MATDFNVFAWRIPGREESGGLPSMGSNRVRHNRSYLAAAYLSAKSYEKQEMCLIASVV